MSINAIQIESQLKANYREFLIIQKQLEQIGVNNPLHKQLCGRLDMLKKAQNYWAGQYNMLTGKNILATAVQVVPNASNPLPPNIPVKPINPIIPVKQYNPTDSAPNTMDGWKTMREKIKIAMIGNPNYVKVQNYLDNAEKEAGNGVPQIPNALVFGKGRQRGDIFGQDYYAKPFTHVFIEDDDGAVIIYQNGAVLKTLPDSLYVNYENQHHPYSLVIQDTIPDVNLNKDELNNAFETLRGE